MRRWKLFRWTRVTHSVGRVLRAKDEMFVHTDIPEAPWYTVEADDKRRARLNCISHLLGQIPYTDVVTAPLELPSRPHGGDYQRPPRDLYRAVPDVAEKLIANT